MANEIRYEAWTRQESGTFERKFPIRGEVRGNFTLDMFGRSSLAIPMNDPRIDDYLFIDQTDRTNDKASIIRAFIGEDILYDFYVESSDRTFTDTGDRVAMLEGGNRGTCLDRVKIRQPDWDDTSPSAQPDWSWGRNSIASPNADMENSPDSLQNPGAEDGNTLGWIAGISFDGSGWVYQPDSFLAVENTGDADVGDWYFEIIADLYAGVFQEIPVVGGTWDVEGEADVPGENYTISARIYAAVGEIVDMVVTNAHSASVGTFSNGSVLSQITGNGAYQTANITFEAENDGRSEIKFISADTGGSPITFRVDEVTVEGFGIGVADWIYSGDVTTFQASAIVAHSGTYSLAWYPNSGILGNDSVSLIIDTVPNVEIAASVWVYHTEAAARDIRIVLEIPGVDPNASNVASNVVSVAPTTWTQLTAAGVAVSGQTDLEIRWEQTGAPVSNLHVDDAEVTVGKAKAFLGVILNELLDHASTDLSGFNRTALTWLTRTWTNTLDSAGNAWDEEIGFVARRGLSYQEVITEMEGLGYQFTLDVNPADDTDWQLNAYNPDWVGTDHTAADGPAVLSKPGVVSAGPFVRREPTATYTMAEGADLEWDDYRDTDMETVWGEIEEYVSVPDMPVTSLARTAEEVVTADTGESLVMSFQNHNLVPGIDYVEGDTIYVTVGESFQPTRKYRVAGISGADTTTTPTYQVEFQPVVGP